MPKIVRVLSDLPLEGKKYQPNALIQLDDKLAKTLEGAGAVDSDPNAVAYCKDKLRVQVVKHEPAETAGAADGSDTEASGGKAADA